MGDSTPFPSPAAIARAELFTRERFVYEGETLEDALAPGSARRRALDAAVAELDAGADTPSIEWRRQFSLLLGLERLLSEEEPHLADGTVLSAHQVDALSGTLTALLAEAQRNGNGNGNGAGQRRPRRRPEPARRRRPSSPRRHGRAILAASEDATPTLDVELDDDDDEDERRGRGAAGLAGRGQSSTRTSSSTSSPRIPTPTGASGSSTRPAPARRSPRSASSRPRAPAAS